MPNDVIVRSRLAFTPLSADPPAWARMLGVSVEACEFLATSDLIDLHLDLEVPIRLLGFDPSRRRVTGKLPPRFFGHTDYVRLREGGFTAVVYDIATNPFRPAHNRHRTTLANVNAALARIERHPEDLAVVRTLSEYRNAREQGRLALWLSLQGGNALEADLSVLDGPLGDRLHRVTLVHLTSSAIGGTSSPLGADGGLRPLGRELIERCNHRRILVDLAHAGKRTFWQALEAHDRTVPPIVSHTGVCGVYRHWRNVDDDQVRAIADRGGVVGIMFHSPYLERLWPWQRGGRRAIVDHLEHIVRLVGDDFAALGTDYDGVIIPPRDLPDVTAMPLLVQDMLDRGWSAERIGKILGRNYLRVVERIRPA